MSSQASSNEVLTPRQVARAIGVSESSVKRWCDSGVIATVRTAGGHRRLRVEDVQRFLEQSGHAVVDRKVLGLPSTTGSSDRILHRAEQEFEQALLQGEEAVARQVVLDLHTAGHGLSAILDRVMLCVMQRLREHSTAEAEPAQEYASHRAVETCLRILHELRLQLPVPDPAALQALTASLDGAPDVLRVTAAELVLRDAGFHAVSLGVQLPFATLDTAITTHRPRLFCLDVAIVRNPPEFLRCIASLRTTARSQGSSLVVGGEGLTDELRSALDVDGIYSDFQSLEQEAARLLEA